MDKIKILFAITQVKGNGAEHVMFQLANYMNECGHEVQLLVTNQKSYEADTNGLLEDIKITFIEDSVYKSKSNTLYTKTVSFMCRMFEMIGKPVPDMWSRKSFLNVYGDHVQAVKNFLKGMDDWKIVVFLQPANQILMMACNGLSNPLIISERADPNRYFKTRYARLFLKFYYPYVSGAVFQTNDAMEMYSAIKTDNRRVILNPIPESLPESYSGKRSKTIVNFCRLAKQKNLPLLIDAFDLFAERHNDYSLKIIGDGELKDELLDYVKTKKHPQNIEIIPHRHDIHQLIKDCAMFVSSSDYEGMSNSMLEAMAIGLPVICTDCPIGGASTVIQDHVNGILVPINDKEKLCAAMEELADNKELAELLAENAVKIRKEQSIDIIGKQWLQVLENA